MAQDKYTATWVSYSSIGDFLKCPRAYYLKNVYKDPKTLNKIQLMNPALSLGQSIHNVLDTISLLPRDQRFQDPLTKYFDIEWQKISGERGGFLNEEHEYVYKKRGNAMLSNVYNNPGPLANLAVKIKQDLPQFWISEDDNIILCGKLDWMEYLPDTDGVHIIDFKTGKRKEDPDSLQLPIYHLLASKCQSRKVEKASYWYLENQTCCDAVALPELEESYQKVLNIAKKIKLARQLEKFQCPEGDDGCKCCQPIEKIVRGECKLVGQDDFNRDLYINVDDSGSGQESEIL